VTEATPTNQPIPITALEPKTRLEGTVKETRLHGAVIDIGLEYDGLLHISQLSPNNNINRVTDVIKPGDSVTVWVAKVHSGQKRISLTMVEPPKVAWNEMAEGQICTGAVTRIESYGAFVDIGAERPGLLHVREMSSGYVGHPSELVSMGEEVDVRILKVDRRKRRIDLTMMGLEAKVEEEPEIEELSEEEETSQTSMELALQRAYAAGQEQESKPRSEKKRQTDFSERQDIMARTLEQHSE
jgi:small subunit ribosomal protein S1